MKTFIKALCVGVAVSGLCLLIGLLSTQSIVPVLLIAAGFGLLASTDVIIATPREASWTVTVTQNADISWQAQIDPNVDTPITYKKTITGFLSKEEALNDAERLIDSWREEIHRKSTKFTYIR